MTQYCTHPAEREWNPGDAPALPEADTCDHPECRPRDLPVESIARLNVRPGETLMVRCHRALSAQDAATIRRTAEAAVPDGVKVLIVASDIELSVITARDEGDD